MLTAQELVLKSSRLVSLPEIYLRIKQVLDEPQAGMEEVAEVIRCDPGLAARILEIANSAFYGFPSKIDTVSRAAGLLGAKRIHDLVLSTTVCRAFERIPEKVMNMDIFWQNSIYCAVLSQLLALHYGKRDSESMFIQGLLSDVGHLIMFQHVPDLCNSAFIAANQGNLPLHEAEKEIIGCHYAEIGGALLHSWNLSSSLHSVVSHQVDPAAAGEFQIEASLVNIAAQITRAAEPDIPLVDRSCELDWTASLLEPLTEESCADVKKAADKAAQEALALIFPGHSIAA